MQARDGVFLEDLCPKVRARQWRRELHQLTGHRCLYCGSPSESIDHVYPRSRGGVSEDHNCVPACLDCNGAKGDSEAFTWYRSQSFYDPRRAMALRAWMEGDRSLAQRLLSWASPTQAATAAGTTTAGTTAAGQAGTAGLADTQADPSMAAKVAVDRIRRQRSGKPTHQTRQAAAPLWRWQMAS